VPRHGEFRAALLAFAFPLYISRRLTENGRFAEVFPLREDHFFLVANESSSS
jgi:hypothetical protein